ncbi:MAG: DUF1217 domain-containing protein [Pseudomonadota bacterium]
MNFQPVLPLGGYAGWGVLKRTMAAQQQAFQASAVNQRDEAYFRERIGAINTAEELVADRRLLGVALGAYGLENDINNRYFIRKVLEDGTLTEDALANRLADKQYLKFSSAFGFGDYAIPGNKVSDFADTTLALYRTRQFEAAVGSQNNDYRYALNAERELATLATKTMGEDAKWFTVMGSAPLRQVFQTALGLPTSFAAIDLDQQLAVLKDKAEARFGADSISQFSDPAKVEALVKGFLLRSELTTGASASSPGMLALQLLQS